MSKEAHKEVHIGFVGTSSATTAEQSALVKTIIRYACPTSLQHGVLHHGDCLGGDVQMHELARQQKFVVTIHPPSGGQRAYCDGDYVMEPRASDVRNRAVVDSCEVFIGAPDGPSRSGPSETWTAINYAVKQGKRGVVVYPDGQYYELAEQKVLP